MLAGCDSVCEISEAWSLPEACGLSRGADLVLLEATEAGRLGVTAAIDGLRCAGAPAVIVVAGDSDPELVRDSLHAGAMSFALTWSDLRALHATVAAALDGQGLVPTEVVQPALEQAHTRMRAIVESLALAVEAKDSVTSLHLRSVTLLAVQLAAQIDPEIAESDEFRYGCLLHDVGKIGVPERILSKPGPLTDDEWVVMRSHPDTGARVVEPLGLPQTVVDIVRHHHERWDGLGYPDGLVGEEIPLAARIFAVCDALDAMTSERPYRDPLPHSIAYARVRREAGRQFDPTVIAALERGVLRGEIELGDPGTSARGGEPRSSRTRRRRAYAGGMGLARPGVVRSL
jgi:putative nucleotidyltransferase with HDIG domain